MKHFVSSYDILHFSILMRLTRYTIEFKDHIKEQNPSHKINNK